MLNIEIIIVRGIVGIDVCEDAIKKRKEKNVSDDKIIMINEKNIPEQ